jgi:tRNA threonylcarbamoyl adenosine modification protein YjeE
MGLGIDETSVASPTFALIHEHHGRLRLAHVDLFRLSSPSAVQDLGLYDYADHRTVMAVEWPDLGSAQLPPDRLDIALAHAGKTRRDIHFVARGKRANATLARLVEAMRRVPKAASGTGRRGVKRRTTPS